ncbi:uncharacterized protein [Acropora muricata]|uniref:uncharacterized protein isoform X2 n=1 Tax=Acropora muricata TaxID=159855 RepID=UPI0034E5A01A
MDREEEEVGAGGGGTVRLKHPLGRSRQSEVDQAEGHALSLTKAKDGDGLNVTLVTNDEGWKITVTDQLLTELAKDPSVKLSGLVEKTIPEVEAWAKKLNIKLFLPKKMIAFRGKELLSFPPDDLDIDVLIIHSYGIDLGKQAQVIKENKNCKWVHVVHTISEELAKFGKEEIHDSEHDVQLELCECADMIIAIGPKVAEAYRTYLRSSGKYVFDLTPGIAHDLIDVRPVVECGEFFRIMVSATYYEKYFEAKGIDIAAQAINLLQDSSYHIFFLVTPKEDTKVLESNLKGHLNPKQFTVRQFKRNPKEWKRLLCQVQLAILPSRAEGFGTSILSALSAAVPVLIGGNTGLGMAVKKLPSGAEYIIDSDEPQFWADKIKEVRERGVGKCSDDAKQLRKEYMEKYSTQEQCHALVKKMLEFFPDKQGRLRKSVEHVDEVDTVRVSYVEPGIQPTKSSSVGHAEEVDTMKGSYFESKIEQGKGFSPPDQGNESGAMAQPVKNMGAQEELGSEMKLQSLSGLSIEETSPHHGYDVVDAGSTYQEPTSKLLMPLTKLPYGIRGEICLKLDIRDDLHFRDFRLLGEKMGFSKDVTRNLEQRQHPTNELLHLWSRKSSKAKVGCLIEMLKDKDFDRSDVVEVLENWVYGKGQE